MEAPIELDAQQLDNVQETHPLSPLQEGILFEHALHEQHDTHLLSTLFELQSHAHLRQLIDALSQVIARHEMLRSAIVWKKPAQPRLVVYRRVKLPVEELAPVSGADPIQHLKSVMSRGRGGLDLSKAPLMWLQVMPDPNGKQWYALLHVHHIVCDHSSWSCIVSEAMSLLAGRRDLPAAVGHRTYVEWAREHARADETEAFFRRELSDLEDARQPFGLSDLHVEGSQIDEARGLMPPALAQRIRAQAKRHGVSAARLFHAAWALVVARTSGHDDVVFGTVSSVAYAKRMRGQRMVGLFINTLPIRLRLADLTVEDLIGQVERQLAEVLKHDQIANVQRCRAGSGDAPLFTTTLNYRYSVGHSVVDPDAAADAAPGVRIIGYQSARAYPLTLVVDNLGDNFALTVNAARPVDPDRVLAYVRTAMESLVGALESAPRTQVRELSVLPSEEWEQVVRSFNATRAEWPREKLIHELFEEQVERTPDATAVACEGQSLTYAQLNRRANQLARYLREKGVGPDRLVALCLPRGLDVLVGMFGTLKAGGAYVPLDPANPSERLRHVLADAAPMVVLSGEGSDAVPETDAPVVSLEAQAEEIAQQSEANLDARSFTLSPNNLAYVIYTSGSTGKPKGVGIEHRNIVNYAVHAVRQFDVAAGDGSLICTSFSFDLMLTGLYPPLLCGRTVRLCAEREGVPLLEEELLRCRNLAPLKITPSHLALLERALKNGQLAGCVRTLVFGGEPLHGDKVQLWRRHAPESRIFNHYGPTETTVGCVVNEIGIEGAGAIPIGRPISNVQVYILDERLQPVPIGVAGDIYVGGAGVARGYLRQPELTKERFVPDPFSADREARLYETGDVGRWKSDGAVEFLGRRDDQVKIRGFRIELGDIEAQLTRHPQVAQAAVIAREDVPGDKRLVAYVVAHRDARADDATESGFEQHLVTQLRAYLQAQLPDYMVPSAWAVLAEMPITPNGKTDRRALAALQAMEPVRDYDPPDGDIEGAVAAIWADVLHVERVGRRDNFFEIGGNSLLGMKVLVRIGETLKIVPPLVSVFRHPTVLEMASLVETLLAQNVASLSAADPERERGAI